MAPKHGSHHSALRRCTACCFTWFHGFTAMVWLRETNGKGLPEPETLHEIWALHCQGPRQQISISNIYSLKAIFNQQSQTSNNCISKSGVQNSLLRPLLVPRKAGSAQLVDKAKITRPWETTANLLSRKRMQQKMMSTCISRYGNIFLQSNPPKLTQTSGRIARPLPSQGT